MTSPHSPFPISQRGYPSPLQNPASATVSDGRGLRGTLGRNLCFRSVPEEEENRGPLPQPAKTSEFRKSPPQLQPQTLQLQLVPGSHPGACASTAPFVYGSDARRRGLRATGGSLASSGSTSAFPVSALASTALLPLFCLQLYLRWAWTGEAIAGLLFWVLRPRIEEG